MKITWKKMSEVLSWVFLFAMIGLLIYTSITTFHAKKTGESAFLFGYRPVLVLTGSMEPYMMTNSLVITKEVTDINELEVGDVVTYHLLNAEGRLLRITHRIIAIDNGNIYTKGDNNRVSDGYELTIDNIESEVVAVFNQTAWIAQKWQTTTGKVLIISFSAAAVLLYYAIRAFIKDRRIQAETAVSEDPADDSVELVPSEDESSDQKLDT